MKTISVEELAAKWAQVEAEVQRGETYEVLNGGRTTARIVPAETPRKVEKWPDFLSAAAPGRGLSTTEQIRLDRDARW